MSNAADGTMKMLLATASAPYALSGSLSLSLQGAGSRKLIDGGTELIANGGDITKVNLLSVGASAFASNLGAELVSSKFSLSIANGFESSSLSQAAINFTVGRVNGKIHDSYLKFTGKFPFNSGFSKAFLGSLSIGSQSGTKFFTSN